MVDFISINKMSIKVGLILVFFASTTVLAKNEVYIGNKVFNIKLKTEDQQEKLEILKNDDIDFWRNPVVQHKVDGLAMVPPSHIKWFEQKLEDIGLEKDIVIEDVYDFLNELKNDFVKTNRNAGNRPFTFDAYFRYNEIVQHLRTLASTHNAMQVVESGTTEEGRQVVHVKISNTNFNNPTKPLIVIEAGIIAREWITIPAAINLINQLFLAPNFNLLNGIDWIILPVANPDGYEYTHTNLRNWKKNRSSLNSSICAGVNINRNFDIAWRQLGASSSPCSQSFAGFEPFSEYESQIIKDIFEEQRNRISMYISIQNQGPLVSYPWRFEQAASGMFRRHHLLGMDILRILGKTQDNPLSVGSIAFGERASGTATDYMQHNGVWYSINLGVRQADGRNGFIIPEASIRSFIEPIWRAVNVAANYVLENRR